MYSNNRDNDYSIYMQKRPVRVAFIINPISIKNEQLDEIFKFNMQHWGGRANPIIPSINGNISKEYWNLLLYCDPDVIYTYDDLSDNTIKRIAKYIAPISFVKHKDKETRIYFSGSYEMPSVGSFNNWEDLFVASGQKKYVYFSNQKAWDHYSFVNRNFGVYVDLMFEQNSPITLTKTLFAHPQEPNLKDFFDYLSRNRYLVNFPIELSALNWKGFRNHDYKHDNAFYVYVGDDVWNWLHMWDRGFLTSKWRMQNLSSICIPENIFDNTEYLESIKDLINTHVGRYSSSNLPEIVFASHTYDVEKMKEFVSKFNDTRFAGRISYRKIEQDNFDNIELLSNTDLEWSESDKTVSSNSLKTLLSDLRPVFLNEKNTQKLWICDLRIRYRPERFQYTNAKYWWDLPKTTAVSRLFFENYRKSRVSKNSNISMLVSDNDKNIELIIPDDTYVLRDLLIGDKLFSEKEDLRSKVYVKSPYEEIRLSDKGQYVSGVLGLFSNHFYAKDIIDNHYWRDVFEMMCQEKEENSIRKLTEIENRLKKNMSSIKSDLEKNPEHSMKWLSRFIFNTAKEIKEVKAEITFKQLLTKLEKERTEFINSHSAEGFKNDYETNCNDLKEAVNGFLENGILLQGVNSRCHSCGTTTWFNINDMRTLIKCPGCRSDILIEAEAEWVYKLNELVKHSFTKHGVIPVLWSLGFTLQFSHSSFIALPSIEFRKDYFGEPISEIDFVCISDGKLLIAEVKTNVDDFSDEEVQKLIKISKEVMADKIVISALYAGKTKKGFEKLREYAKTIEEATIMDDIKVEIYSPQHWFSEFAYHL